jgi:hypothetical protein
MAPRGLLNNNNAAKRGKIARVPAKGAERNQSGQSTSNTKTIDNFKNTLKEEIKRITGKENYVGTKGKPRAKVLIELLQYHGIINNDITLNTIEDYNKLKNIIKTKYNTNNLSIILKENNMKNIINKKIQKFKNNINSNNVNSLINGIEKLLQTNSNMLKIYYNNNTHKKQFLDILIRYMKILYKLNNKNFQERNYLYANLNRDPKTFLNKYINDYLNKSKNIMITKKYIGDIPSYDKLVRVRKPLQNSYYVKIRKTKKNYSNLSNTIPSSFLLNNNNRYLTNSENSTRTQLNKKRTNVIKKINTEKRNTSNNIPIVTLLNNTIVRNKGKITRDNIDILSFVIWMDQIHDSLLKGSYQDSFDNNKTFIQFIKNNTNKENHLKNIKNHELFKILEAKGIIIVNNIEHFKLKTEFETDIYGNLEELFKIDNKDFKKIAHNMNFIKRLNKYYSGISINSRNISRNITRKIPNDKLFYTLEAKVDPGSSMLSTKHVMGNIKRGRTNIKEKRLHLVPVSISSSRRIFKGGKIEYGTNNGNLKLKILNKYIDIGKSKKGAKKTNNYEDKLSKTFGDFMHALSIASISRPKIYFLTFDAMASFIYLFIYKYILNKKDNNINLIVSRGRIIKIFSKHRDPVNISIQSSNGAEYISL